MYINMSGSLEYMLFGEIRSCLSVEQSSQLKISCSFHSNGWVQIE